MLNNVESQILAIINNVKYGRVIVEVQDGKVFRVVKEESIKF